MAFKHFTCVASALLALGGAALASLGGAALAGPVPRAQVEAAVARVEAMAAEMVAAGEVPGLAIGVVHDDAVVWTAGFGLRRMGAPEPVGADTVFQLASLSKAVSATVVAALVGDGVLDWDSRVRDLDPGFALHDAYPTAEVTIADLLNHRSGVPGGAGNDLEEIGFDRDTVMARLRLVPPWTSFRGGYAYSNAAFTEGGLAAAKPAGKDWESVAAERLFTPLGMSTASFRYSDFLGRPDAAALHVRVKGAWTPLVARDPTAQAPAGGASASVRDLTRWMRMALAQGRLDGKEVIAPDALAAIHAPLMSRGVHPISGGQSFYGLGWDVEFGRHGRSWAHAGAFSHGALTMVKLLPDSGLGIVALSNGFPTGAPNALVDSFLDLAVDGTLARDHLPPWAALYGGLFEPDIAAAKARFAAPPDPATPARPADAYAGRYANPYVGEALVAREGDGLVLRLGPEGKMRFALTHFDRDLFLYYPDAEMPDRPSAARFALAADGAAEAITLESLDANGLGTLRRAPR